jgi:hypothetical protein
MGSLQYSAAYVGGVRNHLRRADEDRHCSRVRLESPSALGPTDSMVRLVWLGPTQTVFTTSFLRGETPVGTAKLCVNHGEHCGKCVLCVSPVWYKP